MFAIVLSSGLCLLFEAEPREKCVSVKCTLFLSSFSEPNDKKFDMQAILNPILNHYWQNMRYES